MKQNRVSTILTISIETDLLDALMGMNELSEKKRSKSRLIEDMVRKGMEAS